MHLTLSLRLWLIFVLLNLSHLCVNGNLCVCFGCTLLFVWCFIVSMNCFVFTRKSSILSFYTPKKRNNNATYSRHAINNQIQKLSSTFATYNIFVFIDLKRFQNFFLAWQVPFYVYKKGSRVQKFACRPKIIHTSQIWWKSDTLTMEYFFSRKLTIFFNFS